MRCGRAADEEALGIKMKLHFMTVIVVIAHVAQHHIVVVVGFLFLFCLLLRHPIEGNIFAWISLTVSHQLL